MAALSRTFSTDANAEKEQIYRDRTHPFDTEIRWWIHFEEIQIQMRWHCDHNNYTEGHCDQQPDRFLKLTPLLPVSLVTRRSSPVVVVSKMCVASWSGWFRTALFRALRASLRLTFHGKRFATSDIDFRSTHTPYFALRRLRWQWIHRKFKCHFF